MYASTPGKLLRSRYQVLSPLGKGGFGQTFIAADLDLPDHPRCVVKQLKPASSDRYFLDNARRLFQSEAQSLLRLGTHDQIPRLLAYFEEDQEFYLVQELIEGRPLSEELPPGKRWSELDVCELLYEVLNILHFIHAQGVIHRDLKPDNLIRRHCDRKPVLVDFGTVKEIRTPGFSRYTRTSSVATIAVGTPGYMPTEQGRGKPRPNSDIYALGIIGIQAVTGLNPDQFQEEPETGELIWQPWAQVSEPLAAILTQMVRYYFRDRYQTAHQVLTDLAPLLGKPIPESEQREPAPTLVGLPLPPAIETLVSSPIQSDIKPSIEAGVQADIQAGIQSNIAPPVETDAIAASVQAPEPIQQSVESEIASPAIQELTETLVPSHTVEQPDISSENVEIAEPVTSSRSSKILRTVLAIPSEFYFIVIAGVSVAVAIASGSLLLRSPQPAPSPAVSHSVQPTQPNLDQETLDAAISLANTGKIDSLNQAVQKIKAIKSDSPLYAKARTQELVWQKKLLQNYFDNEVSKKYPKIAEIISEVKPEIKQLDNAEITISYNSSGNADFNDPEIIKNFSVVFIELLRGNQKDVSRAYANFNEITVYPSDSKQKATLKASDWDAYVKTGAEGDQILEKVTLSDR